MAEVSVDAHEVRELAADFTRVPGELSRHAIPVLSKGALNIKNQMRSEILQSAVGQKRGVESSITYDLHDGGYLAEIGPRKGGPGSIANIAYFGGAHGGGGSAPDPRGALEAEAPNVEREILDIVSRVLGR